MVDPVNMPVLRLLDANANRAREALRVLEDYARFILDSDDLSARLKHLRHDLTAATRPWLADAILYRDTPGDVGTGHSTASELKREDLSEVVIAAGKRLSEALRAIEEFSKVAGIGSERSTLNVQHSTSNEDIGNRSKSIETIRYRFYDLEQAIARTLRSPSRFENVRLYVLITESACQNPWLETAEAAIRGGADALQLREKNLECGEFLRRARQLVKLCRDHGKISIINDRADIAMLADADGVHVGQGDLPAIEARNIVGRGKIVGVSTHEISQAGKAVTDGADYIGVGPIFRSSTKPRDWAEIPGLEYATQVAHKIRIPAVGIAGINADNIERVMETGIKAIAVTAAVTGCDDVESATQLLSEKMRAI